MATLLKGLSAERVAQQQAAGKVNKTPDASSKSSARIVAENIFTYFNGIFALLAGLVIYTGSYKSLTFLPAIIANTIIGIVQQLRAKAVLDKLSLLAVSEVTVIRDGKEERVPVDQLVLEDMVYLEAGQQVPADAEVVEGKAAVNEALLTGESDEIDKALGDELMSGSFVASGSCYARLTRVGADSYAAKLTAQAKQIKDKQSEMVSGINLFVKIAGVAIIPIGAALVWEDLFIKGRTMAESINAMVSAVTGMIPEGLYLLVTIALTLSAARLARKKVLLHDMRSTEALARVDVLCVDKTGTITTNDMTVTEVFPAVDKAEMGEFYMQLLARYVSTITDSNTTMRALKRHFAEAEPFEDAKIVPFSSAAKFSEITVGNFILRFGAPEFLLSPQEMEANREIIEQRTRRGERVLALTGALKHSDFIAMSFVSLKNDLRPNVEETFAYLAEQGVQVKVISGDAPLTVSSIAQIVGIPGAERYVDVSTLTTPDELREAAKTYTVFGRVKPDQKKQLVLALKEDGTRVAMTGDGVNDILAMKEADCSIAMGAGSDAAMQSAQVVLLDSDFSHMREIIGEGRRDINNITRSATLFLYKNLFSAMLASFSIILFFSYPLQPTQVTLVSGFNIGLPAFLLAFEPNEKKQKGHFLTETVLKSMPAAFASFAGIGAMVLFADLFSISAEEVSTASTFLLSAVGFIILKNICTPMNRYRATVMALCITGMVACSLMFSNLFSISALTARCVVLTVVFAMAEESVMRAMGYLFNRLRSYIER